MPAVAHKNRAPVYVTLTSMSTVLVVPPPVPVIVTVPLRDVELLLLPPLQDIAPNITISRNDPKRT